jgi:hypothetical protein
MLPQREISPAARRPSRGDDAPGAATALATQQSAVLAPVEMHDEIPGGLVLDLDDPLGSQSERFPDKRLHAHRLPTSCFLGLQGGHPVGQGLEARSSFD